MLTDIERLEIEDALKHYPDKQAGAIDALLMLQQHRGWISDESLRDLATPLGMTPADLDGIATFYNLIFRKPVGRHVVFICDSISCWIKGSEDVRDEFAQRFGVPLGQTTNDGRLTVLPIACLWHCENAPALMIDGQMHVKVRPDQIGRIMDRYT